MVVVSTVLTTVQYLFKMNFKELYQLLEPHVYSFTWFRFYIKKRLGSSEVVGCLLQSSSSIRKPFTIKRIEDKIKELELPLKVVDDNPDVNFFEIIIA